MEPTITITKFSLNEYHWCASIPFYGRWINIHAKEYCETKDEAIHQATCEITMKSNFSKDDVIINDS